MQAQIGATTNSCQSDVWRNDRHMKSPQSIMWSWTRLIFNGLLVTDGGPENDLRKAAVRGVFQQVDIWRRVIMWYYAYLTIQGPFDAKQTFLPTNDWIIFHIAQFCEDNQIHFGIDDFAHPLFSQQHALSSRIFRAGLLLDIRPIPKRYRMRSTYEGVLRIRCGEEWRGRKSAWSMKP